MRLSGQLAAHRRARRSRLWRVVCVQGGTAGDASAWSVPISRARRRQQAGPGGRGPRAGRRRPSMSTPCGPAGSSSSARRSAPCAPSSRSPSPSRAPASSSRSRFEEGQKVKSGDVLLRSTPTSAAPTSSSAKAETRRASALRDEAQDPARPGHGAEPHRRRHRGPGRGSHRPGEDPGERHRLRRGAAQGAPRPASRT